MESARRKSRGIITAAWAGAATITGTATVSATTAETASTPSFVAGDKGEGIDLQDDLLQVFMHYFLLRCQLGKLIFVTLACVACRVCGQLILVG
jgi:hypothetical protein